MLDTLRNGMQLHGSVRWVLTLTVVFERLLDGDEQKLIREIQLDFVGAVLHISTTVLAWHREKSHPITRKQSNAFTQSGRT